MAGGQLLLRKVSSKLKAMLLIVFEELRLLDRGLGWVLIGRLRDLVRLAGDLKIWRGVAALADFCLRQDFIDGLLDLPFPSQLGDGGT